MDYAATKAYLQGLQSPGAKYGIDRMRLLAARLDHPERAYPVVHVAGTNGKGSVCAMLDAIHRKMDRTVGMYTSPHLVFLGERVQVNRRPLTPDELCRYVETVRTHAEAIAAKNPDDGPSYFEFMTAAAFLRFKEERVDVALIEVGLGGRLDATNVVQPQLCVITSIGFDHMDYLGDTLALIAVEKAGIIKPGVPVVLGRLPPEAEAPIRAIATERHAPVHSVREVFGEDINNYPHTRLAGSYQRVNASTATLATQVLEKLLPVTDAARAAALAEVDWPARWQTFPLSGGRTLILDASHNLEGAQTLDENVANLRRETGRAPIVLVGALGEHRAKALLDVAARHAREIILLQPNQPRTTPFEVLERLVPKNFAGPVRRGLVAEIFATPGECALGEPGDTIVVTGSMYLLGEILERFAHPTRAGEGTLQDRL
jgi:dihydrofolate synthase / folylpolyglutamate synthase